MTQAAVFGEALFDLIEHTQNQLNAYIGGSPFNVARSLVRQGITTSYLSPISNDIYGERLYAYAQKEGIVVDKTKRSLLPTSLALVYKDEHGQPDYRLYRKHIADLDIDAKTLLSLVPNETQLFHTGSLALVPSMLEVLQECFTVLKAKGIKISIDVNMRKGVELDESSYINSVNTLAKYADFIKVSDEDLSLLGNKSTPLEGAKKLLSQLNNGLVLLTEGEKGACLLSESFQISKLVYKPKVFCDAVGAGDTFFSAFLAQAMRVGHLSAPWQKGPLEEALSFGLMAATLNIQKEGCQPPNQDEVLQALNEV